MVDSKNSSPEIMIEALDKIKSHVSSGYPDLKTKTSYMTVIYGFEDYFLSSGKTPADALGDYYQSTTKALPFENPGSVTLRRKARPILMLRDILAGEIPKRRYCYSGHIPLAPEFIQYMELYSKWMIEEGKSSGTITTRSGRMRVFFCFLHEKTVNLLPV